MTRSSRIAFALTSILIVSAGTGCEALYDYARAHNGDQGSGAEPPPAKICASSAACGDGTFCTVDEGTCNPPPDCGPKATCPGVCYGTCEPTKAPPPTGEPCGPKICDAGAVCCNASCGICTPPGGACTQQFCTPPPPPAGCLTDGDCHAFANYCDGCACDAGADSQKAPACSGTIVQCLVDPCDGKQAVCKAGQCVLASPAPPAPAAKCGTDADCRTFSNYCGGCACDALAVGEKDPICNGTVVQCFADPCLNQKALCSAGQCVLASAAPPKCDQRTQGGSTSCKPSDLWKQYASDDCKASGVVLTEISPREDCGGGFTRFVDYTCCTR